MHFASIIVVLADEATSRNGWTDEKGLGAWFPWLSTQAAQTHTSADVMN